MEAMAIVKGEASIMFGIDGGVEIESAERRWFRRSGNRSMGQQRLPQWSRVEFGRAELARERRGEA